MVQVSHKLLHKCCLGSFFFRKVLVAEIYSQRIEEDKKRRAPTGPRIPYFGQRRSPASARLEMHGIPIDVKKGMTQAVGRINNMNNKERESTKL